MSAEAVIACLESDGGPFEARRLSYELPPDVFERCSPYTRWFFSHFGDGTGVSQDALISGSWRRDTLLLQKYEEMGSEERLEVHAIIGFLVHEANHKADLLISPFGLQYFGILLREYEVLQQFLPRALDHVEYVDSIRVLAKLTEPHDGFLTKEPAIREWWDELRLVVRKEIAWGDLGSLTPTLPQIEVGWDGFDSISAHYFGTSLALEQVKILNSFYSFRPVGTKLWYIRPATIFETKAVAGTLLYLLSIAPDMSEVLLYYQRTYLDRKDSYIPDYFFALDQIAVMHGFDDLEHVFKVNNPDLLRHVLMCAQSLCWFALHAPPQLRDGEKKSGVAGNPVLRLFAGMHALMDCLKRAKEEGLITLAQVLMLIEQHPVFIALEQAPIAQVLNDCRSFLAAVDKRVDLLWNPSVRSHFRRVFAMAAPLIVDREDRYDHGLGQPQEGNGRLYARTKAQMEVYYNDHVPKGDYAEWLSMRSTLFFSTAPPSAEYIARLDKHFEALFVWLLECEHCNIAHIFWVSRFEKNHVVPCPLTGKAVTLEVNEIRHLPALEKPDPD